MNSSGHTLRTGLLALFGSLLAVLVVANADGDIVTSQGENNEAEATSDPITDNLPAATGPAPFLVAESLSSESAEFEFMLHRLSQSNSTDTVESVDGHFVCCSIDGPSSIATIPEPSAFGIPLFLLVVWVLTTRERRRLAGCCWR